MREHRISSGWFKSILAVSYRVTEVMGFFYLRKYKNILESFISPFLQSGVLLSSLLAEVWVPLEAVNDSLRASSESPEELSVCTHQESSAPACTHPSCWVSFTNISWGCSLSSPLSRNKSFLRAAAWAATGEMELRLFPLWGCVLSGWAPCTQDLSWAELSWASCGCCPWQEAAIALGLLLGPDPKNSP